MENNGTPNKIMKRLPIYLNYLRSLPESVENISATTMAKDLGLGDVQVRKDLATISETGRQKVGRPKQQLIRDIERHLNVATATGAVVVGIGNLGQALLAYGGFLDFGVNILAGFDAQATGKSSKAEKPIFPMNRLPAFCRNNEVGMGIIAVPASCAQQVCDLLVDCGIRAIWNFAPTNLRVPENVVVKNENLAVSISTLRQQYLKLP